MDKYTRKGILGVQTCFRLERSQLERLDLLPKLPVVNDMRESARSGHLRRAVREYLSRLERLEDVV